MKTWLKISLGLLVWVGALGSGCSDAETNQPVTVAAAIQAIQQAPDPSAVVAAYGSGLAVAPNDPKLHEAYVARMVDMGLPEMAFHQAQTLTTLQPNNGLAWGVVAYVDARRGQMPEAVSAINLAGQFASSNKFVAHTAGEILAWYDLKADKAKLPDNAKDGLTRDPGPARQTTGVHRSLRHGPKGLPDADQRRATVGARGSRRDRLRRPSPGHAGNCANLPGRLCPSGRYRASDGVAHGPGCGP